MIPRHLKNEAYIPSPKIQHLHPHGLKWVVGDSINDSNKILVYIRTTINTSSGFFLGNPGQWYFSLFNPLCYLLTVLPRASQGPRRGSMLTTLNRKILRARSPPHVLVLGNPCTTLAENPYATVHSTKSPATTPWIKAPKTVTD